MHRASIYNELILKNRDDACMTPGTKLIEAERGVLIDGSNLDFCFALCFTKVIVETLL